MGMLRTRFRHCQAWPGCPLRVLDSAFRLLVAGPDPVAIDGHAVPGFPGRLVALDEVRDRCLERPELADGAWSVVVSRAQLLGGVWTVGAAGVGLPLLRNVASRLTDRFTDDPTDVHAAVLTGFLGELAVIDPTVSRLAGRLRWAAWSAGRAALREALGAPPPSGDAFWSSEPAAPFGHPDLVLARAVAEGVISRGEADLIGTTRLEDVSLHDYAAAHGRSYAACRQARLRAERKIIRFLGSAPDGDGSEPMVVADGPSRWSARHLPPRWSPVTVSGRGLGEKSRRPVSPTGPDQAVPSCRITTRSRSPRCR